MNNGYSICFNEWALDKDIKNELGLLLIISSLCAEKGYCFASNKYLADLFNETEQTISGKIRHLKEKGYITIEYKKRGCEIISRQIRLSKILIDDYEKSYSTVKENLKDNNISINNISINNNKRGVFKKPTIEEIQEYCNERNNNINANNFYDFYESKNWMIGKNKMKDWKACVRTWEQRSIKNTKVIPSWFNKEIKTEETTDDENFSDFIKEFRNE